MANNSSEQAIRDGLAQFRLAGIIGDVDVPMRQVYVRGLKDINGGVIVASVDRLLKQAGRRFPITLPEWIEACASVVDERRARAARQAKALTEDCPDCMGTGWSNAEGPNAVIRCNCVKRALVLMAEAEAPIARPALPAYEGAE